MLSAQHRLGAVSRRAADTAALPAHTQTPGLLSCLDDD